MQITNNEGRGIRTQNNVAEHTATVQLLIPTEAKRRVLLVPQVTNTQEGQTISFYALANSMLPNPQSKTPSRRTQNMWFMLNMDNKWTNEINENWDQTNPVRDSNRKMFDLILTGAPFNSIIVSGNISEEYVPANFEVDLTEINNKAKELLAAMSKLKAAKSPAEKRTAEKDVLQKYEEHQAIKEQMISEFKLAKSNVIFAKQNGLVLANSIVQGFQISGHQTLTAENLWQNPKSKMTFAPAVNQFVGGMQISQEQIDDNHEAFVYGVQTTQDGNREFCRKAAALNTVGREIKVRADIYDNALTTRSRAETFEQTTARNPEILAIDGKISLHPFAKYSESNQIILASKFHIEIVSYVSMQTNASNVNEVSAFDFDVTSIDL